MTNLLGVSKRAATALVLATAALSAHAAGTVVNLTARAATVTLPDGKSVPMWQFCGSLDATATNAGTVTGGACGASWAPAPTIVVPAGSDLTIALNNTLKLPTSVVILGQLGGGLGSPTKFASPAHAPQTSTTFPAAGTDNGTFTPPAQPGRVQSFGTETAAGTTASYTWTNLRPGTYLYEAGTLPSLQVPMGLYGVLVVTQAPVAADPTTGTAFAPGVAYPAFGSRTTPAGVYDGDAVMLFSEIDPVQNAAVDAAATAGTATTLRIDDPTCTAQGGSVPCYPAAVNYSPRYFLINGQSYDATNPASSTAALGSAYASGRLLLRLANAGSRLHVPSIVGLPVSILAEDGNLAPGLPKVQNEVGLQAGKTFDVTVGPAADGTGAYAAKTYSLFDRQGSTSAGGLSGGGMQALLAVNSAAVAGGGVPTALTPKVVNDAFQVPFNTAINGNVKLNDVAAAAISLGTNVAHGALVLNADGTFVYTPANGYSGADTFTYTASNVTNTATVTLTVGSKGAAPTAVADTFTSAVVGSFKTSAPGVLANDTDPSGLLLNATLASAGNCGTVTLAKDGSFSVAGASGTSCSFTYNAVNSQGTASAAPATVTVSFGAAGTRSGLNVAVVDAKSGAPITDYRWLVQEDLTFKPDASKTPSLSTRTIGTSFHRSHMNVVASGCVGDKSCGLGQTVRGAVIAAGPASTLDKVALDPNKDYYISILPGDTMDDAPHQMAGIAIPRKSVAALTANVASNELFTIKAQPGPINPAQLSVFIYEDNNPTNNQYDTGEQGLGGFNIILVDAVGRSGDPAGQQTYDMFGMPLANALLGRPGCPDLLNTHAALGDDGQNLVGVVYTCPNASRAEQDAARAADLVLDPSGATTTNRDALATKYALAGHALIKYLEPARYDVLAYAAADREAAGERWWQVETLEGTFAQDAFVGTNEPKYFQEFGPPGFHTSIGFVNPDHVIQYGQQNAGVKAASDGATAFTISGKITNQHMSRPSQVTLWDSGSYDLLSSTVCRVVLNSAAGNGPAVAITECDADGNFSLVGIPPGDYEMQIFDRWLDQIIQAKAVTVAAADVALGNIPVLSWFTQHDQNIFLDLNGNGIYDPGEPGIANVLMTNRYRNGSISNQTLTDVNGNGLLPELFPLFNWYVSEADLTRFKQTGVTTIVDGGGATDTTGDFAGLISTKDATGASTISTTLPGAYSYGNQGFISQRNRIDWGRAPYAEGENGGIQGLVVYSSTRPFDDQRYNVQTIWEPLVPRVKMNLYRRTTLADGSSTLTLVDTTFTSSFDDWVNLVYDSTGNNKYILLADGSLVDPDTRLAAPAGVTAGKQVNMSCPGQLPAPAPGALPPYDTTSVDPFAQYTLALAGSTIPDLTRCYDGFHNWNQVQPAPYDGRYAFPSPAYIKAHPLTAAQKAAGQTLVSLPQGDYVVEAVTPDGYEIVKEEDKNIFTGDQFNGPAAAQFAGLGALFILPDQATLNNNNPYNTKTADGVRINATTNNGVNASMNQAMPECVGSLHRVPDYLSIYPQAQLAAPFAGMDRPLCDRKLVRLQDQQQYTANFFVFTPVPMAANGAGIILDDASAEFNAFAPDFGEKASVPFVPVSVKDWAGQEITRVYADQWGAYNLMYPSSWTVNPPTPSGYLPNMLVNCMNDPGPIPERDATGKLTGRMITDPQYNPAYSNFCYTLPFMPGQTTYLDTPVLPIAAFAQGYNPADCEYPDATPAIKSVNTSAGFGPYLPGSSGTITISSLGDRSVPNPAYSGPFATSGLAGQREVQRHYGFGSAKGTVKIGNVTIPAGNVAWTDATITVTVPAGVSSGQLVVTTAAGQASTDAVTVTIGGSAPKRVDLNGGADFTAIQPAIDAANPGDLILVNAGTYNELVIMWKPVRLQGVGGASVVINAAKFPTVKLDNWRPVINALFGVDINTGNNNANAQVDALPGQEITGGVVLLEPSVLGTEEGAGITVVAKGLRPDGVTPLTAADCPVIGVTPQPVFDLANGANSTAYPVWSNFLCGASRIDGIGITGGDAGGGIYVNGWAHDLEIANNKVYGNAGAYNGGIRIGVPYLEQETLPVDANGNVRVANNAVVGFGFDRNVKIHHNYIAKNGTVEAPAGNGGAGGGVSLCTGTDGYSVDHNWICGNYGSSDGGGIGHIGFSQGGTIAFNQILFNESFQQTTTTGGGGIAVVAEPALAGALPLGTGSVTIDANVIRGNSVQGGKGGGILLQGVNGQDTALNSTAQWFKATVTNNIVDNNIAGQAGAGISLSDTVVSSIVNNTVAANDSLGIAGVVLQKAKGRPEPAGIVVGRNSAALVASIGNKLTGNSRQISNPTLSNNIVWRNRSFYYGGNGALCAGNSSNTAGACVQVADQAATGQCDATNARYWEIGVYDDAGITPPANGPRLNPQYSVMTSIDGYGGTVNVAAIQRASVALRVVTLTFSANPGFAAGQVVTVSGYTGNTNSLFNGTFTILAVVNQGTVHTVTYTDTNFAVATVATTTQANTTASVTSPPTNAANDPLLADLYCNGSRGMPELASVINPPMTKNYQVAVTADEGNNFVNVKYGPLYLAKTADNGTTYSRFGDYHLSNAATAGNSSAVDHGTPGIVNHDVDNEGRPQGTAWDIGADELVVAARSPSVTPTALNFTTLAGQVSAAQTVTLSNPAGNPTLTGLSFTFPANFRRAAGGGGAAGTCGTTLNANASCTVNVVFTPAAGTSGVQTGSLTIGTTTPAVTMPSVNLTGTAARAAFTAASLGTLTATPTLAFGNLSGAQSSTVTVTVTGAAVTFGTAGVANGNGTAFSKGTDTCSGTTIGAGNTCTIVVNFNAPTGNNNRTGTLTLPTTSPAASNLTLGLSGS